MQLLLWVTCNVSHSREEDNPGLSIICGSKLHFSSGKGGRKET